MELGLALKHIGHGLVSIEVPPPSVHDADEAQLERVRCKVSLGAASGTAPSERINVNLISYRFCICFPLPLPRPLVSVSPFFS